MTRSLEDLLSSTENTVDLLRNSPGSPNVYPGVPAEFSNWRVEQQAWQRTCVLFNLSYHMVDLLVEGPDALKLLSRLAINSFEGFTTDRAKHFVPCTPDGCVIGDVILYALGENRFNLVGRAPAINWVMYHADTGGYDVTVELDQRWALRTDGRRKSYRFQVQGPNAMQVIEKVLGQAPPELKFFHVTGLTIAGKSVQALRHGMAGQPGWELFGPWEEGEPVREAIVAAGEEFGLEQVGGRAYSTNTLESGWIPSPLPAVYTGAAAEALPRMAAGRRLRREGLARRQLRLGKHRGLLLHSLGPRLRPLREVRPRLHRPRGARADGRRRASHQGHPRVRRRGRYPHGRDDVPEDRSRQVHRHAFGRVRDAPVRHGHRRRGDGPGCRPGSATARTRGRCCPWRCSIRSTPSRGRGDGEWGEPGGGTAKLTVEPHVQTEIRAVVSPVPYVETVRKAYAPGSWRATAGAR